MVNDATRKKVLARIRGIAGPLRSVARTIEEDPYCADILLQISSAQAALGQAGKVALRSHVETRVTDTLATGTLGEWKQNLDELMEVFTRHASLGERSLT